MSANIYIAFFFRLVNFGVLIGILWYCFKRYLLAGMQDAMKQQEADREQLHNKEISLKKEQSRILQEIEQEKNERTVLLTKVKGWHSAVQESQQVRVLSMREKDLSWQKRLEAQYCYAQSQRVKKKLMQEVLSQAHKDLEALLSNTSTNKEYVETVIHYLREKP